MWPCRHRPRGNRRAAKGPIKGCEGFAGLQEQAGATGLGPRGRRAAAAHVRRDQSCRLRPLLPVYYVSVGRRAWSTPASRSALRGSQEDSHVVHRGSFSLLTSFPFGSYACCMEAGPGCADSHCRFLGPGRRMMACSSVMCATCGASPCQRSLGTATVTRRFTRHRERTASCSSKHAHHRYRIRSTAYLHCPATRSHEQQWGETLRAAVAHKAAGR